MANTPAREIQVRDEVKHLKQKDIYGVVLHKYQYPSNGVWLLDVRLPDDKIRYATFMSNWETTVPVENLE